MMDPLIQRLRNEAEAFDKARAQKLDINFKYKKDGIVRDVLNPPDYEHADVWGHDYADDPVQPLQAGEAWNAGRRQTASGVAYSFDDKGRPLNPYMNTGLNGRGCLGQFGPNHAVDNGVIVVRPDAQGVMTAYALGILRKYDGNAPAFSGGFAKFQKDAQGQYIIDHKAIIQTRVEEFFEEMVSGSITLLPEYQVQLDTATNALLAALLSARKGVPLSADEQIHVRTETETALKLAQVEAKDPAFMQRLTDLVAQGHECYAGPVLCDNRNTNNAWMETRLSWFLMDDQIWADIKGANPVFDYQLSAGDDASGVVYHRLDADLVKNGYASHGALFAIMMASYLEYAEKNAVFVPPSVVAQAEDMASFLENAVRPAPQPISAPKLTP